MAYGGEAGIKPNRIMSNIKEHLYKNKESNSIDISNALEVDFMSNNNTKKRSVTFETISVIELHAENGNYVVVTKDDIVEIAKDFGLNLQSTK